MRRFLHNLKRIRMHHNFVDEWSKSAMKLETRNVVALQISTRKSGDVTILDLRGRSTINSGESKLLGSHLQELVGNGVHKLLLNLTNLTQVDSTGVSIIATTYDSLRDQGGDLKLLCPTGRVLAVFTALRLLDVIPSFEDETQALASFRPLGNSQNRAEHDGSQDAGKRRDSESC